MYYLHIELYYVNFNVIYVLFKSLGSVQLFWMFLKVSYAQPSMHLFDNIYSKDNNSNTIITIKN